MKRYWIFALIVLLFTFGGCKQNKKDFLEPVSFYYCNDIAAEETSNDAFYNIFVSEPHEGAGYSDNLKSLLNHYLQGPIDETLVNPFPAGLQVVSVQEEDAHLVLIVSDELSALTGLDLTIACTCLSMTVMELSTCDTVQISAESTLLDEHDAITMTRDILIFSDDTYIVSGD